jgi:hypothetical protein
MKFSKIIKLVVPCALLFVGGIFFTPSRSHALGLKIAPLLYEEKLNKGDIKKGFIDISNPDDIRKTINVEVDGFKQINNNGDLGFHEAPEYQTGIRLDYDSFELGPREAVRFAFQLEADKLPRGGVYGAILFSSTTSDVNPDTTSVKTVTRVGTLFLIDNGGIGVRKALVESVKAPFLQVNSDGIKANVTVKNIGGQNGLAYFPTIEAAVQPFGKSSAKKASLVFPGIARENEVLKKGSYFGLVRLKVNVGTDVRYKWVFVATGNARWMALGLLVFAMTLGYGLVQLRHYKIRRKKRDGALD